MSRWFRMKTKSPVVGQSLSGPGRLLFAFGKFTFSATLTFALRTDLHTGKSATGQKITDLLLFPVEP